MRQIAIGGWPGTSIAVATSAWEGLRKERDAGGDPAAVKRAARVAAAPPPRSAGYSLRQLVDDYLAGHVDVHRKAKGAAEVRRMFDRNLGALGDVQAAEVKRAKAFDFLEGMAPTPVQTAMLRQQLGAA